MSSEKFNIQEFLGRMTENQEGEKGLNKDSLSFYGLHEKIRTDREPWISCYLMKGFADLEAAVSTIGTLSEGFGLQIYLKGNKFPHTHISWIRDVLPYQLSWLRKIDPAAVNGNSFELSLSIDFGQVDPHELLTRIFPRGYEFKQYPQRHENYQDFKGIIKIL